MRGSPDARNMHLLGKLWGILPESFFIRVILHQCEFELSFSTEFTAWMLPTTKVMSNTQMSTSDSDDLDAKIRKWFCDEDDHEDHTENLTKSSPRNAADVAHKTTDSEILGKKESTKSVQTVNVNEGPFSAEKDTAHAQCDVSTSGKLCQGAAGYDEAELTMNAIVVSKSRQKWLNSLECEGYEGQLYVRMHELEKEPGFPLSWWKDNEQSVDRVLVQTPIEAHATAGIFTLKKGLPSSSALTSAMSTIAELLTSTKKFAYSVSTPQLFLPSNGGFSQEYFADKSEDASCRCFWFFGPRQSRPEEDSTTEREHMFIASGGNNVQTFGKDKVLTMAGYFGKGNRKFRLHCGDILIMSTKFPFALDLPIGGRACGSRIFSWLLYPKKEEMIIPVVAKVPENITKY